VLSPGNRTKPCKFRYVKPVVKFIWKIIAIKTEKVTFSMTALSSDISEARRISAKVLYLIPQTMGYIYAANVVLVISDKWKLRQNEINELVWFAGVCLSFMSIMRTTNTEYWPSSSRPTLNMKLTRISYQATNCVVCIPQLAIDSIESVKWLNGCTIMPYRKS